MPRQEQRRVEVLTRALIGALSDAEAADQLGLSVRQVRRLKTTLASEGPAALVHGNRERFFHQTVERWRRERPAALSVEIDLETFVLAAQRQPGRPPDGFVFHVGRCGSTLLANMLSASGQHLVIKESSGVNALMAGLL